MSDITDKLDDIYEDLELLREEEYTEFIEEQGKIYARLSNLVNKLFEIMNSRMED